MTTLNNTDNPCPHGPDHHEPPRLDTIPLDGEETIFATRTITRTWNGGL